MAKLAVNNKLKLEQPKSESNDGITTIKDFNKFRSIFDKAIDSYEKDPNRNYKISSTYVTPKGMSRIITYDPKAKKFIAVDNRIGELYTEEFDTEEEARNFLMSDEFTGEEFRK